MSNGSTYDVRHHGQNPLNFLLGESSEEPRTEREIPPYQTSQPSTPTTLSPHNPQPPQPHPPSTRSRFLPNIATHRTTAALLSTTSTTSATSALSYRMGLHTDHVAAFLVLVASSSPVLGVDLGKIQAITASSAFDDFARSQSAYSAASSWYTDRLSHDAAEGSRAPYVACAGYKQGRHALTSLETAFTKSAVHRVSNTEADGSCFIVTALPSSATAVIRAPEDFDLLSAAPLLPSLKLATSLLDHGPDTSPRLGAADDFDLSDHSAPLRSTYGEGMTLDNVHGLSVRLSPGVLTAGGGESFAEAFLRDWHADLTSESVNMRRASFWSDSDADRSEYDVTRVREWSRAAAVVDGLASKSARTVGEICGFGKLKLRHVADDLVLVEGKHDFDGWAVDGMFCWGEDIFGSIVTVFLHYFRYFCETLSSFVGELP